MRFKLFLIELGGRICNIPYLLFYICFVSFEVQEQMFQNVHSNSNKSLCIDKTCPQLALVVNVCMKSVNICLHCLSALVIFPELFQIAWKIYV